MNPVNSGSEEREGGKGFIPVPTHYTHCTRIPYFSATHYIVHFTVIENTIFLTHVSDQATLMM